MVPAYNADPCPCRDSEIVLDTESLDLIVRDPQWVLAHEDEFWRLRPQVLTLKWGEAVGRAIDRGAWREQVSDWAALPAPERENHALTRNCREIIASKARFLAKALPHICSFLPPEADLGVRVNFTAFIPARAFAVEDVLINVAAPYWKDNPDNILSCLVHEVGHVGHSFCRSVGPDDGLPKGDLCGMLYGLQGEGFCDYVAYLARDEFPAPDEVDFRLWEDPEEVRRQVSVFNEVLGAVGRVSPDEFAKLIWDKCIQGNRAYYIAGMHCCHTIVEHLGKEALTKTLIEGPLAFVRLYNSLVKGDWAIRLPATTAPGAAPPAGG